MPPDGSPWLYLLLLLVLILVNAFFAMSEIAIISLNDNKLRMMVKEGNKKAGILLGMVEQPSNFLATIQVGVTLSGFLASAVAADTFAAYIVYWLRNTPIPEGIVKGVSLVAITLILSYFTLVFGELVPKRLAMQAYEKISFAIARPLSVIAKIEKPFVWILSKSTNLCLRIVGIDPNAKPEEVTEEEIRMMIDVGEETGNIEGIEKAMLHNIFEFDDLTVDEIMTHRTEMIAISQDTPLKDVVDLALSEGYSRFPVYREDLDDIVGILYVKDLLNLIVGDVGEDYRWQQHMREVLYVPESNKCNDLFSEFQKTKIHVAIVVDEYGGTSGMVTMEDLVESIVGNIQDEYDDDEDEILQIGEGEYILDGIVSIEEVERLFSIKFTDDDSETISGYLIDQLEHIPKQGEHFEARVGDVTFTVMDVAEHRISKVKAVQVPEEPAAEEVEQ